MKKIFTLLAVALFAFSAQAQTLIDFSQSQTIGITVNGTTSIDAVKLKTNTASTPGIKFANSYTTNDESNGNNAELTVDGGFKAGDVVTIAGAFNNADDTKQSKIDIFTLDGTTPTVLYTTAQFINGRLVNDDPVEETYTLTNDVEKLYIGRNGNTGTFVTTLKIVRGGTETTIGGDTPTPTADGIIDYPTLQDGITVNGTTTFDAVKLKTNTASTPGIKFANSYTTNDESNGNNAELTVDGGFKAGDVVTIAGAFNNADDTKQSKIDIFTLDGTTPTVLYTTAQFINGRLVNDDPVEETYTLTDDVEKLYIGRNGNTGTFVTKLKVTRDGTTGIVELPVNIKYNGAMYDLSGRRVNENYRGVVIMNGKKVLNK